MHRIAPLGLKRFMAFGSEAQALGAPVIKGKCNF